LKLFLNDERLEGKMHKYIYLSTYSVLLAAILLSAGCIQVGSKSITTFTTTSPDGKKISVGYAKTNKWAVKTSCNISSSDTCYYGIWQGDIGTAARDKFDHSMSLQVGKSTRLPAEYVEFTVCVATEKELDPKTCARNLYVFSPDGKSVNANSHQKTSVTAGTSAADKNAATNAAATNNK
jgi:hypothetical protein